VSTVPFVRSDRPGAEPRFSWRVLLAAFTAIAILRFTYVFLDDVTRGVTGTLTRRAIEEGTGAYGALLLFGLIAVMERRYPLVDGGWRRSWPVHGGALLVYSAAHTTVTWLSRLALVPLIEGVSYDPGRIGVRYLMEVPNDVIVYCAAIGVLTLVRTRHGLREREIRVAAVARAAAEARQEALSGRLQPHFLFNALNTISAAVHDNPAAADQMIGHLGDLLRRSLRASDQPEFALSDEIEVLRAYLAIIGARFGDRVRVDLQVDPAADFVAVPAFLLQPLVENAVRHGSGGDQTSAISVRIERQDADVFISIENEMSGVARGDPIPGTGLATTRDRLRALYGDAFSFTAHADGNHFRVATRIPARTTRALPRISDPALHASAPR